jgi:cytochrome b
MITTKHNIVWDLFIRIFHWTLVAAFIISYLTEGEVYLHFYSGWYIVILLICRILWGFIGSKHARFIDFIKPPTEIIDYAKSLRKNDGSIKHYVGHNPLGGLMVVAMLLSLSLTCVTGVLLYSEDGKAIFSFTQYSPTASVEEDHPTEDTTTPYLNKHLKSSLNDDDDDDKLINEKYEQQATTVNASPNRTNYDEDENEGEGEEFLKEIHELLANLTILLILLHIAGVILSSRLHQENLIKAMFTGKKSN